MNCPERVAGHVNGETVVAARRVIAGGAAEVTRNLPRPRSLDPDVTDPGPRGHGHLRRADCHGHDDEDFLEWRRDGLTDKRSRVTQKCCAAARLPIKFRHPYQAVWYG